jgi:hypothetical protein
MDEPILSLQRTYRQKCTKAIRDEIAATLASLKVPPESCTTAEPIFLARETAERVRKATHGLWVALEALYERVRSDPSARSRLAIPPMLEAIFYLESSAPPPLFIGRADALIVNGAPRFLEWNPLPADVLGSRALAKAFVRPLAALDLQPENLTIAEHAAASIAAVGRALDLSNGPVIGVIDVAGAKPTSDSMAALLSGAGARVVFSTADAASLGNGRLALGGEAVDLVHVEDWSFIRNFDLAHPIVQALGLGAVRLLNGAARNVTLGMKSAFALLSDPGADGLVPHDVLRALEGTVPWTRLVADVKTTYRGESVDLLTLVETRQESFVLKPTLGASGQDVVLGWRTSPSDFRVAIDLFLERGGVVQERVEGSTQTFLDLEGSEAEHAYDVSPFVWAGGEVAGYVTRLMGASGHHNLARGGTDVPLVVV